MADESSLPPAHPTPAEEARARIRAFQNTENDTLSLLDLNLTDFGLSEISDELIQLSHLRDLDLEGNQLTTLPDNFENLSQLQHLDLRNNQLTTLPDNFENLSQLQHLYLSGNQLTTLPDNFENLSQLKHLYLSGNQLTTLPDNFENLSQLESLNLSGNQLTTLPDNFENLSQLKHLYLSGNQLTTLPDNFENLSQLEHLDLSGNQLTTLPDNFEDLSQLKSLNLSGNQLTTVPDNFENLSQLESLNLSDNQLTTLPDNFENLSQLESLNLSGNQLTTLPDNFGNLSQLKHLYLSRNQLTTLPDNFENLSQLQHLYLSRNQLTTLPDNFENLSQLKHLDLSGNQLTTLPDNFENLSQLKHLDLSGNSLDHETESAFESGGITGLIEYLKGVRAAIAGEKQWEGKVILVGEGTVGKSTLRYAFHDKDYKGETTHGVERDCLKLPHPTETDQQLICNIWDFGGQRVYRPTHQFFFSDQAIYLIVWRPDDNASEQSVKEWMRLIKRRVGDEARFILVATHNKPNSRRPDVNLESLKREFGRDQVCGMFHVDSLGEGRLGVDQVKQAITQVALKNDFFLRRPSKYYRDSLKALASKTNLYLKRETVQELCKANGIVDEDGTEERFELFLKYATQLGHLTWFAQFPEYVILQPEWLAKAISYVLNDKTTEKANGTITETRLFQIWKRQNYAHTVHPLLLALMQHYDLCYPLKGDAPQQLISQLVDENEPASLTDVWPVICPEGVNEQRVEFLFEDPPAPEGLPSDQLPDPVDLSNQGLFFWLITRFHDFSLGRTDFLKSVHWKKGMVIGADDDGQALLQVKQNRLLVSARGNYPGYLLGLIGQQIQLLHGRLLSGTNLKVAYSCLPQCSRAAGARGAGYLDFKRLEHACSKGNSVDCNAHECYENLNAGNILSGVPFRLKVRDARGISSEFEERLTEIISEGITTKFASQFNELRDILFTTLNDESRHGPRLFHLDKADESLLDKAKRATHILLEVTLYCEHSKEPVYSLRKGDGNDDDPPKGVYRVEFQKELFRKILKISRFAVKLTGFGTGFLAEDSIADFGDEVREMGGSLKAGQGDLDYGDRIHGQRIEAWGPTLREFHELLAKETNARSKDGFGGLVRVINPRGEYRWIYPKFKDEPGYHAGPGKLIDENT